MPLAIFLDLIEGPKGHKGPKFDTFWLVWSGWQREKQFSIKFTNIQISRTMNSFVIQKIGGSPSSVSINFIAMELSVPAAIHYIWTNHHMGLFIQFKIFQSMISKYFLKVHHLGHLHDTLQSEIIIILYLI